MADLPNPWDNYARLQTKLSRTRVVTDQTWGNEAALNRTLADAGDGLAPTADEVSVAAASEARRERRYAFLRVVHLADDPTLVHPEAHLAARQDIRAAKAVISSTDWALLCGVATGHS
jgi:hypothetical protein